VLVTRLNVIFDLTSPLMHAWLTYIVKSVRWHLVPFFSSSRRHSPRRDFILVRAIEQMEVQKLTILDMTLASHVRVYVLPPFDISSCC
jgi:hypothetical protein